MNLQDTIGRCLVKEVRIDADCLSLAGTLTIPDDAKGIVLFAHGSGSSRHSPRNQFVAKALVANGMATLLFDLLTPREEVLDQRTASLRFDIDLLSKRLVGATRWSMRNADTQSLRIGYFGASTGAAAALAAAARMQESVAAVVSRGGRPDLAGRALRLVLAPTLLIVGGRDETVLELNWMALRQLHCAPKELIVIPGATHLFKEPGTLEEVARAASRWFSRYLVDKKAEGSVSPDDQHYRRR